MVYEQPAAVAQALAELETLRGRATAGLAFEFAARVQAEISSLGWIIGPQRAAAEPGLTATPAGWAAFATRNAELAATLTRIAPRAG